jgi:ABC-type transport system involved in multi-copper enzyme maturation permease subunit
MKPKDQDQLESLFEDSAYQRAQRIGKFRKLVPRLWLAAVILFVATILGISLLTFYYGLQKDLKDMLIFFLIWLLFGFILGCAFTLVLSVIPYKWINWKRRLDFWLPITTMIAMVVVLTTIIISLVAGDVDAVSFS